MSEQIVFGLLEKIGTLALLAYTIVYTTAQVGQLKEAVVKLTAVIEGMTK